MPARSPPARAPEPHHPVRLAPSDASLAPCRARRRNGSIPLLWWRPVSILTVTLNPALDVSGVVDAVVPEDKLRLEDLRFEPGGGGVNVARAVAAMGGRATACFPSGGAHGKRIEALLDAQGVDHRAVPIEGLTRQSLTVGERRSHRQFRFVMPGPELTAAECEACLEAISTADPPPTILVVSGSVPEGVDPQLVGQIVAAGVAAGSRVIVDTSGPALAVALEAGPYLVKPNLREFLTVVGGEVDHVDDALAQAALELIARTGTEALVVSVGVGGALLATGGRALRFASPVVPIQSRVGAGDSMVAGIALALARGDDLDLAVRLGVAAGAAAVMTPGSELCRKEDVERLYHQLLRQAPDLLVGDRREPPATEGRNDR